jgi:hypothetical protein
MNNVLHVICTLIEEQLASGTFTSKDLIYRQDNPEGDPQGNTQKT